MPYIANRKSGETLADGILARFTSQTASAFAVGASQPRTSSIALLAEGDNFRPPNPHLPQLPVRLQSRIGEDMQIIVDNELLLGRRNDKP